MSSIAEDGYATFMNKKTEADAGDIQACMSVALKYAVGDKEIGLARDNEISVKYYMKAADAGEPEAGYQLHHSFKFGLGAPRDGAKALGYLTLAIERKYFRAMCEMGRSYLEGQLVSYSPEKAFDFFRQCTLQAIENSDKMRRFEKMVIDVLYYPLCLALGIGCPADAEAAQKIFNLLADKGFMDAREFLETGRILDGTVLLTLQNAGHKNPDLSKFATLKKDNSNFIDCTPPKTTVDQTDLATIVKTGESLWYGDAQTVKNSAEAVKWFLKGAEKNHPDCLYYLGLASMLENGGMPRNDILGCDYLEKAIKGGARHAASAKSTLGHTLLFLKDPGKKEYACRLFRESGDAGHESGQLFYAYCLLLGIGCAQNIEEAKVRLNAAAALGRKDARELLDENKLYASIFISAAGIDTRQKDADGRTYYDVSALLGPLAKKEPTKELSPVSLEETLKKLDSLTGLRGVKEQIRTLTNRCKLDSLRKQQGLTTSTMNLHLIFTGNPGTGKTTVARILGDILRGAGVLPKGHVVEVTHADLTGEYIGQTSPRVRTKVQESLGGILFIDEAYSLVDGGAQQSTIRKDAVTTLLKMMEDHAGQFMVIAAGYPEEMKAFIHSNPGLESRFRETVHFDNFDDAELAQIYAAFATENEYTLSAGCPEILSQIMHDVPGKFSKSFGNARFIRNLFEETLERVANRVASNPNPSREDLSLITPFDINSAAEGMKRQNGRR